MTPWLIGLAILATPFILSSIFVCAPKWYRHRVSPFFEGKSPDVEDIDIPEWVVKPLVMILTMILFVPMVAIAIIALWWSALVSVVIMKCPYTTDWTRANAESPDIARRAWEFLMGNPFVRMYNFLAS